MSRYGKGCVPTKSVLAAKTRTPLPTIGQSQCVSFVKSMRQLYDVNASASQSQRVSFAMLTRQLCDVNASTFELLKVVALTSP